MYFPEQAGGPKKLARMAVETGGRLTWNTNAVGLGYTRAVRDLACAYEVAFYDNRPRLDKERRVRVWLKRPGVRAYHASSYVFRSPENKRRSLITAAYMAPDMFENGALEARAFPLRPRSERRWETLVAVIAVERRDHEPGHRRIPVVDDVQVVPQEQQSEEPVRFDARHALVGQLAIRRFDTSQASLHEVFVRAVGPDAALSDDPFRAEIDELFDKLDLPDEVQAKIFRDNARRILKLV